jgi:hypothetical protein
MAHEGLCVPEQPVEASAALEDEEERIAAMGFMDSLQTPVKLVSDSQDIEEPKDKQKDLGETASIPEGSFSPRGAREHDLIEERHLLNASIDLVADKEMHAEETVVSCAPSTIVDSIPEDVLVPQMHADPTLNEDVIERVSAPSPVEPSTTPIDAPVNTAHIYAHSIDISESLNKALEQVPYPEESSPSPIPIVPNLNLSQYSCGFVDSMKGYCLDISSEDDGKVADIESARSMHSANVQVTSRISSQQKTDNSANNITNAQSNKGCFARLFGCGRMRK